MNNMYDILNKMTLLEGRGSRPDFLDLDKDGNRTEPMKDAAKEVDEASYSAKAARAGKDIGKPGKQFAKIAADAAERYGSKERGEKVADAVLAKLRAKEDVNEADVEEGNDFTKARMDAIRAGKPTFKVGGKTFKVTGDTSDEKAQMNESQIEEGFADFFDKKQMYKKIGADVDGKEDDYTVTFKDGTRKRYQNVDGRRRVTTLEPVDRNDAVDDEGEVVKRGRGRPKGTGRKMGARGKTKVDEMELEEDYDQDEYDEEGEMAMSQARTIEDAAKELQDILDADENLPEWVQKKIAIAQEYIDSARDYLKANRPEGEEEMDVEVTGDEEMIPERELSPAEMKKREEIVKSMKKDKAGFEKRYGKRGEEVMYATATKQAKKTAEDKEEVEETTVAGSVATAPAGGKANGIFGQGVYEGAIAESFDNKLKAVLNEGMSINMSMGENGEKSLNVNATEDDAVKLAQILKLAGMGSAHGYEEACPTCGQSPCGCDESIEEGEYSNSPDEQTTDTDTLVNGISGGLNGPKLQVNPNNMADNPLSMTDLGKGPSGQINLGKVAESVKEETENRLWNLYARYESK